MCTHIRYLSHFVGVSTLSDTVLRSASGDVSHLSPRRQQPVDPAPCDIGITITDQGERPLVLLSQVLVPGSFDLIEGL